MGEIDFRYLALRQEKGVDLAVKEYVRQKINAVAVRLPAHLQSKDPDLNAENAGLLGVQMVLVTSDGYTLLRRRGKHVLEYPQAWDVSFSGYSGVNVIQGDHFDLGNTVEFELDKEIKRLRGEPGEIRFTALHLSKPSGTTVMLGFWDVKTT